MNETKVSRIVQIKTGRGWKETYRDENPARVYDSLAHDLIEKKIVACSWIKSIRREPLYTGLQKITVAYDNGTRSIYTVTDH